VGGVVLEHVSSVLGVDEGVVHSDDLDLRVLESVSQDLC
jgi:hypothetical protein